MSEEGVLEIDFRLEQLSEIIFAIFIGSFFNCVIQLSSTIFYNYIKGFVLFGWSDLSLCDRLNNRLCW